MYVFRFSLWIGVKQESVEGSLSSVEEIARDIIQWKIKPPTESRTRERLGLDHFDRAGEPLCAYYVFIMVDYRESSDKTVSRGATAPSCPYFCPSTRSLVCIALGSKRE
ncbi:hypothetical protein KQX54_010536 [Cotesia glomerata]|uniref:Uncharacterized protein n=1 Tax=Cotesia glomerata TaxID=32391 RepID=A0AAV7J0U8_COTGL|nr:hypothetical protein KQX54_010536 [Cotesia glomerata]